VAWEEDLFAVLDDLEAQAAALYDAERAPELADRERAEYQHVPLAARLMASVDHDVVVQVLGVGAVTGRLERVAQGWCLVAGPAQDWVVRLPAVAALDGASDRAVPEVAWPAVARLGVGSALRRLADAGERCVLHRLDGGRHDGVLRRVGLDFVEVLEGDPPRVTLVALTALAAIQSREPG
jgi:hypothetical protein